MTLGVAGIVFEERKDITKGGKDGSWIAPTKSRVRFEARSSQTVEWRCLSFRDARMFGDTAIGSKETEEAEQSCAALLK